MTDQLIVSQVKQKAWEVVDSLINGGGDKPGLGTSLSSSVSMTDATEMYWGTSGRGNPNAKNRIRIVAQIGFVKITRVGRTERVSLTPLGLELHKETI